MSKSFVFKVERPSFQMQAQLSNGEKITLEVFESNANQMRALEKSAGVDSLELTKTHLSQNIKGERAAEFIEDLCENGSLSSFFTAINAEFASLKETKRKN